MAIPQPIDFIVSSRDPERAHDMSAPYPRTRVVLRRSAMLFCGAVTFARAQDTTAARAPADSATPSDTATVTRLRRLETRAVAFGHASLRIARQSERLVFGTDSAVARWSSHDDPASRALRALSPVAFWVPVAAVAAVPIVWADEAQDGHRLNAQYARNAAAALTLGFVASRTAKHFIHRARPCTGGDPDDISVRRPRDSLAACPRGSHVSAYSSFFSEHTMALFAIASTGSFQAQRQGAPNATTVTVVGFTAATVFSIGRIYQGHHWLTDVVIGAAVGTTSGFLAAQLAPAARGRK
jgi:membrane-associated phospholipid phosphatase